MARSSRIVASLVSNCCNPLEAPSGSDEHDDAFEVLVQNCDDACVSTAVGHVTEDTVAQSTLNAAKPRLDRDMWIDEPAPDSS